MTVETIPEHVYFDDSLDLGSDIDEVWLLSTKFLGDFCLLCFASSLCVSLYAVGFVCWDAKANNVLTRFLQPFTDAGCTICDHGGSAPTSTEYVHWVFVSRWALLWWYSSCQNVHALSQHRFSCGSCSKRNVGKVYCRCWFLYLGLYYSAHKEHLPHSHHCHKAWLKFWYMISRSRHRINRGGPHSNSVTVADE
jgi:hypothetical protein